MPAAIKYYEGVMLPKEFIVFSSLGDKAICTVDMMEMDIIN